MRRFVRSVVAASVLAALAISAQAETGSIHPPIPLLDRDGTSVLKSRQPVSTMQSCAGCHDTDYIAAHSYHASLGHDERTTMGSATSGRPWDFGPGRLGRWSPLGYRYLSPPGDWRLDLGVAEWIQTQGWRHVGGGPAVVGHGNSPLDQRGAQATAASGIDSDNQVLAADTAGARDWDWTTSGTVEMNCFLCHVAVPDNAARLDALATGRFRWANTATLAETGLVRPGPEGWNYEDKAFLPDGTVAAETLQLRAPTSEHCGLCHGQTHRGSEPLELDLSLREWSTATKGQVFSSQRICQSAMNLKDKQQLAQPWDVHAEAMLECSSCHFSLNDPTLYKPADRGSPRHLRFEPRRLATGERLRRPSHQFAKGHTAQGTVARHLDGTMRRCNDCHDAEATHDWLPYRDAHFARLSCEACHVPETHAPAIQQVDWTLLGPDGQPGLRWRGIEGHVDDPAALVDGFRPLLLPRKDLDGQTRLVPHNVISSWYWVEGGPAPRPVRLADLKRALLVDGGYHPEVTAALDTNGDGKISPDEQRLDRPEKVAAVRKRLIVAGVNEPRIEAEVQPYGMHHGVAPAKQATRECTTCHSDESRLAEPFLLASFIPGSVPPKPVADSGVDLSGNLRADEVGRLVFQPETGKADLYLVGHDRWLWVNALGSLSLAGVALAVGVHAGMRVRAARCTSRSGKPSASQEPTPESDEA